MLEVYVVTARKRRKKIGLQPQLELGFYGCGPKFSEDSHGMCVTRDKSHEQNTAQGRSIFTAMRKDRTQNCCFKKLLSSQLWEAEAGGSLGLARQPVHLMSELQIPMKGYLQNQNKAKKPNISQIKTR